MLLHALYLTASPSALQISADYFLGRTMFRRNDFWPKNFRLICFSAENDFGWFVCWPKTFRSKKNRPERIRLNFCFGRILFSFRHQNWRPQIFVRLKFFSHAFFQQKSFFRQNIFSHQKIFGQKKSVDFGGTLCSFSRRSFCWMLFSVKSICAQKFYGQFLLVVVIVVL